MRVNVRDLRRKHIICHLAHDHSTERCEGFCEISARYVDEGSCEHAHVWLKHAEPGES